MVAELLGPVAVYWPLLLIFAIIMSTATLVRRWQGWDDEVKEEPRTLTFYRWEAFSSVILAALFSQMIYDELYKPATAWIWLAFLVLMAVLMIQKTVQSLRKVRSLPA